VIRQAGLRRYVQNHTLESAYQSREPVYDGVAEAWFDDTESMRALAGSAEYKAVRDDESRFIDPGSMGVLITDEVVVVDGPESKIKMITFLNKRTDVTAEFFQHHWRENHGPLAAQIPGLLRYVQCHARPGIYAAGRSPVFDGIPISWFEDIQSLRDSGESAAYSQTRADEKNFMISGRLPFVITRAHEIEVQ
jgi:uncharacterized protein (TIGR02118 family)